MNIFVTSSCPKKSAENLDDRRVANFCRETAQILSGALENNGLFIKAIYPDAPKAGKSHLKHGIIQWASATRGNYIWTYSHWTWLLKEYTARYDKVHAYTQFVDQFLYYSRHVPNGPRQDFQNHARRQDRNIDFTHVKDTILAYRMYLRERWRTDPQHSKVKMKVTKYGIPIKTG
jgi:hypothetical protein